MQFNLVVAEVQSELNDTTAAMKLRIERWLNQAHKEICGKKRWDFLVVEQSDEMSIAVAAAPYDTSTITFDTGISHETNWLVGEILQVTDTTSDYSPLESITLSRLRKQLQTSDTETGEPYLWYYEKNLRMDSDNPRRYINFYPGLAETRTFVFSFVRDPKTFAAGSTGKLLIPDRWEHVVFNRVMWKGWRQKADERWADCRDDYLEGLKDMKNSEPCRIYYEYKDGGGIKTRMPRIVTQP